MKFKAIGNAASETVANAPADSADESSSLSRRKFLRNSSSAGVGVGLIVTSKTALGQEATKDGIVRCGIIGYGDEGKALRESSLFLKDYVRFPAVADIWERNRNAGVGQIQAAEQGVGENGETCTGYESAEEMLKNEDLDCVIVASPDFVHHTHTIMGLEAGKDVYCEKLMSNSIESAREMVKPQQRTGKLCHI